MGLKRRWGNALHRLHTASDRWAARGVAKDLTSGKVELRELTIRSANRDAGVFYLPTPSAVLEWLHQSLPRTKGNWSFVDLGAGLGRATISAGRQPYARVVGVEFAGELAAVAKAIIAATEGLRAGSVEVLHMDAASYVLPDGPVIVFLFDPFGPPVITEVAASIARSYAAAPRPIIIAYLNPRYAAVFDALEGFVPAKGRPVPRFLLRTLSPYRLKFYATPESLAAWRR